MSSVYHTKKNEELVQVSDQDYMGLCLHLMQIRMIPPTEVQSRHKSLSDMMITKLKTLLSAVAPFQLHMDPDEQTIKAIVRWKLDVNLRNVERFYFARILAEILEISDSTYDAICAVEIDENMPSNLKDLIRTSNDILKICSDQHRSICHADIDSYMDFYARVLVKIPRGGGVYDISLHSTVDLCTRSSATTFLPGHVAFVVSMGSRFTWHDIKRACQKRLFSRFLLSYTDHQSSSLSRSPSLQILESRSFQRILT